MTIVPVRSNLANLHHDIPAVADVAEDAVAELHAAEVMADLLFRLVDIAPNRELDNPDGPTLENLMASAQVICEP